MELGHEPRLVAVEFNGAIVPRAQWFDQPVAAGDRVEVVVVGGGQNRQACLHFTA